MSQEEKNALLKLPKQCIQSLDYGKSCAEPVQKWYFDIDMKLCYPFEYTGCGADFSNRFDSSEECNDLCAENLQKYFSTVSTDSPVSHLSIVEQSTKPISVKESG